MYDYLLIDGPNMAWRAGSVLYLTSPKGKNVSVVFGMLKMIRSLLEKYSPKVVCVCWDQDSSVYKEKIYPEYKIHRKDKPGLPKDFIIDIKSQIEELRNYLQYFGLRQLRRKYVEADDLIGLLCENLKNVLVVSSDKDMFQVVSMGASLFHPPKDIIINKSNFNEIVGVDPGFYIYYRCITGDRGDGISGLSGFGEVTAKKLINKYGSWLDWFEGDRIKIDILEDMNKRQRNLIQDPESCKILARNYCLMDIGGLIQDKKEEILKDFNSQELVFNEEVIEKFFLENQFDSIMSRFHGWIHPFRVLTLRRKDS